jgi:ABC-type dipeptide/oligopeptide/nickel transport system permease component
MAGVFEEASGHYKGRGFLAYWSFLCNEFFGIFAGAFAMWATEYASRSSHRSTATFAISLAAGSMITAFCQAVLFSHAGIGRWLPIQARVFETPQAPADIFAPFILAGACLFLISVFSVAFVWNMRNIRDHAGIAKPRRERRRTGAREPWI